MSEMGPETREAELIERELRSALGRVDAPSGFRERVMARAAERSGGREARGGWWRVVAASFLLGALCGGWLMHEERVERRQARETREQFAVAMRLTARVTERSFADAGRRINRTEKAEEAR